MSENPIQPMIRDLVFLSPLHPTLGATERRNLGTDVLAPISFLPWWDDAAQCQAFDLIRGLIEILVPFSCGRVRLPLWIQFSDRLTTTDERGPDQTRSKLVHRTSSETPSI